MRFLSVAPLLLMFAGIGLATIGVIPPIVGFGLFVLSGLLAVIAGIVIYFTRVRKGRLNFRILVVIAGAPFVIIAISAAPGLAYPPINDITTDVENPPAFTGTDYADRDMTYPEDFKSVVVDKYPDLKPLTLDESPERVYQHALEIVEARKGWKVVEDNTANTTIEGTAQSYFFHFIDDFVIRVADNGEGKARVDMRSKSRDGKGDLGANAKRIQSFFEELSAE